MAQSIRNDSVNLPWRQPDSDNVKGISVEELQVELKQRQPELEDLDGVDPVAIQPMTKREPAEYLSPTSNAEHLRLSTPRSENPFASPLGSTPVRKLLRVAVARSHSRENKELISLVQQGGMGLDTKSIDRMRASLSRVNKMDRMLIELERMVDAIYTQMASNQNA